MSVADGGCERVRARVPDLHSEHWSCDLGKPPVFSLCHMSSDCFV